MIFFTTIKDLFNNLKDIFGNFYKNKYAIKMFWDMKINISLFNNFY